MRLILLTISILLFLNPIVAQNDSMGYFDVYKNEVQQTLNPALVSDMGKHIVRSDFQLQRNNIIDNNNPLLYWQVAYHTQWRKHGFGIISKNIPASQLIYSNSIGLQYAYGFSLGKNTFWQNTKLNLGTEIGINKWQSNFDDYTFGDQISSQGVVKPETGETPTSDPLYYLSINAGFTIRSRKFYLASNIRDWEGTRTGFYNTESSIQKLKIDIRTGAKLFEVKKFSSWLTYNLLLVEKTDSYGQLGLSVAYKHFILSYKLRHDNAHLTQLSYISPRLRVYAQYQNLPNDFAPYFNYGIFSTGLALAITKQ